jgi:hypothetical protein
VCSVLRDWIKGQVTAIEVGILTFEGAFLGQILLPSGRTVLEHAMQTEILPALENAEPASEPDPAQPELNELVGLAPSSRATPEELQKRLCEQGFPSAWSGAESSSRARPRRTGSAASPSPSRLAACASTSFADTMPKTSKYPKLRVYVKRGRAGQVWTSYAYDMRGTGEPDIRSATTATRRSAAGTRSTTARRASPARSRKRSAAGSSRCCPPTAAR